MFPQFIEKSKGIAISEITSTERFQPTAGAKKGTPIKMSTQFTSEVKNFVEHWVKQEYSQEQIVGRAKEQGLNCVSYERIY